jgi:hypothetical protein
VKIGIRHPSSAGQSHATSGSDSPQPITRLDRPYWVRGYIRRLPNGRFMGVCLTLNLVVEGDSQSEARTKLEELIEAVADAVDNDEVDACSPRRAPAVFYRQYWALRLRSLLHFVQQPFARDSPTRRREPKQLQGQPPRAREQRRAASIERWADRRDILTR